MLIDTIRDLSGSIEASQALLSAVAMGIIAIIVALIRNSMSPKDPDLPIVGDPNALDFRSAMEEAAKRVLDAI